LWVWKSRTLTGIDKGRKVKVWTAPPSGPQSRQIWAPELHRLRGRWYLYYTASDGEDRNHRHYVLEADTDDPQGKYTDRGWVDPDLDHYAIDGSVLEMPGGRLFWLYTTGALWIAPMTTPARADGAKRVQIARADQPWEKGWVEAPQPLVKNRRVFVVYSAGHSGTPHYVLGLLTLARGGDPLDPRAWTKHPDPVFAPYEGPDGRVYTTGHNSFTRSPDNKEDWLIYHAKNEATGGFANRTARAQPFSWNPDGTPNFGRPIPAGVPLPLPSGEKPSQKP
jgi:GH43 family beta-xylosidase